MDQQRHTPPAQNPVASSSSQQQPSSLLQQQQQQQVPQPPRSVKRPRPVKSCTECRKRKLRCDRLLPCSQCQKSGRICKYAADNDSVNLSDASDDDLAALPTRPAKRSFQGTSTTSGGGGAGHPPPVPGSDASPPLLRPGEMGPGGVVAAAAASVETLAGRLERLERVVIGGVPPDTDAAVWRRPLEISPRTVRGLSVKNGGSRTRLHGAGSPRVLLNLFDEAKDFLRDHVNDPELRDVFSSFRKLHKLLRYEFQKSLTPISVFVDSMMPIQKRMVDILPKKPVCDRLIDAYLLNQETAYRILHAPTFKTQYIQFWEGKGHTEGFVPLLLAVLSTACRYETKSRGLSHERSEGVHLPTACALVRIWLNGLGRKQIVELETLQVELSLLITQRMYREHRSDGWAHLGTIVRMALEMGLHRDPSEFGDQIVPFYAEMRRRLWATVADLDYFISNDCNMPSMLREGDVTTQPPRNIDDADIWPGMKELPPGKPLDQITDTQIQAYASVTRGLRIRAASIVRRIDTLTDWTEILNIGAKLERQIEELNTIAPRHGSMSESQKARLWRSLVLLDGHIRRPLINLYRPFTLGVPNVPSQILRGYFRASMGMTTVLEELDPSMSDYIQLSEMMHVMLKGDIEQAALSICYYIRAAMRPMNDGTSLTVQQALRMSPDGEPGGLGAAGAAGEGNTYMWSMPRLIAAAERVLDFLIQNIKRGDTKDIICLSLVIESVRTPDPRPEDMAHGLRQTLDSCLRAANYSLERLSSIPTQPELYPAESYGPSAQTPYVTHVAQTPSFTGSLADAADGWQFWDGWD
jgi:hypothetical protein